jgi:hypothetical protein
MLDYLLEIFLEFREETKFLIPEEMFVINKEDTKQFIKWCLDLVIVHDIDIIFEYSRCDDMLFEKYYDLVTPNTFDEIPENVLEKIRSIGQTTKGNLKSLLMPKKLLKALDYSTLKFFIENGYKQEIKFFLESFYYSTKLKNKEMEISTHLINYIYDVFQEEKLYLNQLVVYIYDKTNDLDLVGKLVELQSTINPQTGKKSFFTVNHLYSFMEIKKYMHDAIYLNVWWNDVFINIKSLEDFLQILAPDLKANPVDAQQLFITFISSFFTPDSMLLITNYVEIPDPHSLLFYSLFLDNMPSGGKIFEKLLDFFIRNNYDYLTCKNQVTMDSNNDAFIKNYLDLYNSNSSVKCSCFCSFDKLFKYSHKCNFMKYLSESNNLNLIVDLIIDHKLKLDDESLTYLMIFASDEINEKLKEIKPKITYEIVKTIRINYLINFIKKRDNDEEIRQFANLINQFHGHVLLDEELLQLHELCNRKSMLIDWNVFFINNSIAYSKDPMIFIKLDCDLDLNLIINQIVRKIINHDSKAFDKLKELLIHQHEIIREFPEIKYSIVIDENILNQIENKDQRRFIKIFLSE